MTQYDDEWRGAERRPSYRRRPAPAYEAPRFDWTGVAALLILILFGAACFWYIVGAARGPGGVGGLGLARQTFFAKWLRFAWRL